MFKYLALFIHVMIMTATGSYASESLKKISFEKISYGLSFESRPLLAYKFMRQGRFATRIAVLLSEGVHGNEYFGMLDKFVSNFEEDRKLPTGIESFINAGGVLLIVPKVNPDGVARKGRFSSFGTDLNRDFKLKQVQMQESFLLTKWVDKELTSTRAQLSLAIDYHCCGGALIHPEESDYFKKYYEDASNLLNQIDSAKIRLGVTKDFFGKRSFGTLKDYWFAKYGAISFTFEATSMDDSALSLSNHQKWWGELLSYIKNAPLIHIAKQNKLNKPVVNSKTQPSYSE